MNRTRLYYDRELDYQCGYRDALAGRPRALGHGASYRQGYDRGLSESCKRIAAARCNHKSNRLYAWFANDGTHCVACCNCGAVLAGAV